MRWMPATLLSLLTLSALAAQTKPDALVSRSKGSAKAPVTVYEMSDFQCPFCRRHAVEWFPILEREYIATGKVRWIYINLPIPSLHANAVAAAMFALCAGQQGKFWPAHDLLYKLQTTWGPLQDPTPFLLGLGDSLKLPKAKLTACVVTNATRGEVRDDSEGALKAGASSTPTFYIEGGLLRGAFPPEVWRPILDSVYLAKTRKP